MNENFTIEETENQGISVDVERGNSFPFYQQGRHGRRVHSAGQGQQHLAATHLVRISFFCSSINAFASSGLLIRSMDSGRRLLMAYSRNNI